MKTKLTCLPLRYIQIFLGNRSTSGVLPLVRSQQLRELSSKPDTKRVSIGDVSIQVHEPKLPELVPRKYFSDKENLPQSILQHLRWIMQKDALGQDIFLIGPPGPLRRQIAMMYLELTHRETEYVSLSRDTTESDLKQRREIRGGTAYYIDQCAVRAAVDGRVLVLEGVEKVERNVLPILNNLLENREMQLEDGRFLMAADRYDKLLNEHTEEELSALKLVRVSDRFRVIALGLPVPRYQGNPLDPPLRSRFQARNINSLPFKEMYTVLLQNRKNISAHRVSQVLSFATALLQSDSSSIGLPDFPISSLHRIVSILDAVPSSSASSAVHRLYPYTLMLGKDGQNSVRTILEKFELDDGDHESGDVTSVEMIGQQQAELDMSLGGNNVKLNLPAGCLTLTPNISGGPFLPTGYHSNTLCQMMLSHLAGDFCLVGPRGCGKSILVRQFAAMLGYCVEPIMLYQDMTSRDLLQQRVTLANGDTAWRFSPLVVAALKGSLVIMDGVHRINQGSFSVLHRLITERELQLFDGTRLLGEERYGAVKVETGLSDEQLSLRGVLPIHPSFRVVALAEPPVVGSSKQQWLSPEMLTTFLYHHLHPLSRAEEADVIAHLVPGVVDLSHLYTFVHKLRHSTDSTLTSLADSLSTRQLLRIARRVTRFPGDDLYGIVHKACLARFLPPLARSALDQLLRECDIIPSAFDSDDVGEAISCEVREGTLHIGKTCIPVNCPENSTKVPDIIFYENPQHLKVMEDMVKDFLLGQHLLLVGNQGVGKNKVVDRFLQLLCRPREYIQLHRDTTVQTLTLQSTVLDGVISYEDSPLVKAVKWGRVLVVDEADKAPTHVTCILKTLVESGEMHLSDGRRVVSESSSIGGGESENVIVLHPEFRMIVLANRPGFPFLGNDFFGAMGDIFSCHAIDNPDVQSEMEMLRRYGPSVPEGLLQKLVMVFGDLRTMADQGLINYPYSTREVVNMVRHLERFPSEGLVTVVKNVIDFDQYNPELRQTLVETLQKHGIPVGSPQAVVRLGTELDLPKFNPTGHWSIMNCKEDQDRSSLQLNINTSRLLLKGPIQLDVQGTELNHVKTRGTIFTEQEAQWELPCGKHDDVTFQSDAIAITMGKQLTKGRPKHDLVHLATCNPVGVYTINVNRNSCNFTDMQNLFPQHIMGYQCRLRLYSLSPPLDNHVVVHEETTNVILLLNADNGEVSRLVSRGLPERLTNKRSYFTTETKLQEHSVMCLSTIPDEQGTILFWTPNYSAGNPEITMLDITTELSHTFHIPFTPKQCFGVDVRKWILLEDRTDRIRQSCSRLPGNGNLCRWPCLAVRQGVGQFRPPLCRNTIKWFEAYLFTRFRKPSVVIVSDDLIGYLEIADFAHQKLRYIPVPGSHAALTMKFFVKGVNTDFCYIPPTFFNYLHSREWLIIRNKAYMRATREMSDPPFVIGSLSDGGLVTIDITGVMRKWETSVLHLEHSMQEWRNMIGYQDSHPLQVNEERESDRSHDDVDLKHGEVDPLNKPHVGGGNFAGGTGGSNTAGLGGFGGPYRLDAGHQVFQVPDWEKQAVPSEITEAARDMARKAHKQRLREIEMSEYDGETYEQLSSAVRRQVQALRVILDGLQAKGKERQWLKNQAYGDLDDARLVEGLAGERTIYKRRGDREPEMGSPPELPKRLRLVVDVSGSMYRFNGHDGRLWRQLEATLMMMEALESYEEKITFDVYGHSGEVFSECFLKTDRQPKNNKERLAILKTMQAHSQFCISGDNTLEAVKHAIGEVGGEEADERFVIALSDANFDRYGINPARFGDLLTGNEDVKAYAIFIGSLGDQAARLSQNLPQGHSYVCLNTERLPMILQQIFASSMLH